MKRVNDKTILHKVVILITATFLSSVVIAQAWLPTALNEYLTANANNNTYRLNRTSIGQALPLAGAPLPANDFKLRVFGGAFAQVQNGVYGNFANANQWIGLGENPNPALGIYGMGMYRDTAYAFYNLQRAFRGVTASRDLIIGAGTNLSTYDTNQRILVKGFFGPASTSRTLISANASKGAVGVNDENPLSTFYVNATGATGSTLNSPFRSIFIINRGVGTDIAKSTFSAMGQEGNSRLNLPVHGFRTQAGDSNATTPLIAANFSVNTTNQTAAGQQEAEIQWQDLNYTGPVRCTNYTGGAQDLFSFYFRNGVNTANTRRRVMTLLGGAHVGINVPAGSPVITDAGMNPFQVGNMVTKIRLHVNGGSVLASGYYATSDSANKTNVKPIQNARKLLSVASPRQYDFLADAKLDIECGIRPVSQFGFIAQELARTELGSVVAKLDDGTFAINYTEFIPLLVQGMNETGGVIAAQAATIDEMTKVIESQKVQLSAMEQWAASVSQKLGIEAPKFVAPVLAGNGTAADRAAAGTNRTVADAFPGTKLLQNNPNPTNGYTEIFYTFNDAGTASIILTDLQGRVRKTFDNIGRGQNKVVVNRGDLEPGNYIYSIKVNGQLVGSKQMTVL